MRPDRYDPMYDPLVEHNNPELYRPQADLDVKDQHIVSLAMKNGFLVGRNSILENRNYKAEDELTKLRRQYEEGMSENKRLRERLDEEQQAKYETQREVDRLKQYETKALAKKAKK